MSYVAVLYDDFKYRVDSVKVLETREDKVLVRFEDGKNGWVAPVFNKKADAEKYAAQQQAWIKRGE